jgi:ribosome-binding protein aMBF1 (putative translation factor)
MAFVSVSEAAKLAKISRSNLYKSYISTGKLSVSKNGKGHSVIDISELHRVFGQLEIKETVDRTKEDTVTQAKTQHATLEDTGKNTALEAENERLRAQLRDYQEREREARERETWLRSQVDKLTDTVKLIEMAKPQEAQKKPSFIARLFSK